MRTDIVDFHVHPFLSAENYLCQYKTNDPLDPDRFQNYLAGLGVAKVCGCVAGQASGWEDIRRLNDQALELRERWGDFYVPGFHIHPDYPEQSLEEIRRMADRGVKLMGELVPYMHGWSLDHPGLIPLLEEAQRHEMVVNYHSTGSKGVLPEHLLSRFPKLTFVAAHPGEKEQFLRHLDRMERFENYYLDLSGSGLARMGLLRCGIDRVGKDRFLFGTDFPICPPAMYIAAVDNDPLLTQEEKQAVFCDNALRLLF